MDRMTMHAMAKKALQANIKVSEFPRVRFFKRDSAKNGKVAFEDVTHKVVKLLLEEEDDDGPCSVSRLDGEDKLIWRTQHQSLQEAKWYVEFEYGLPEEKWSEKKAN